MLSPTIETKPFLVGWVMVWRSSHPDSKMIGSLQELTDRYRIAIELIKQYDTNRERYPSKMEGQTLLLELKHQLTNILNNRVLEQSLYVKLLGMLVVIIYDLGILALNMGDVNEALIYLDDVLQLIPDKISRPTTRFVLLSVEVRNVFGAEYFDINPRVGAKMIDEADKIYCNYRKIFLKNRPYSHWDHFANQVRYAGMNQLVKAHSLTKFYLRQYNYPGSRFFKSLSDCYETLRVMATSKVTDLSSRAEVAILLGEFFINDRKFHFARYMLSIAAYLIDTYEENSKRLEASMEALKINDKKKEAEISEDGSKRKRNKWVGMMSERAMEEGESSLGRNEVLVEVEDRGEETDASEEEGEETEAEGGEADPSHETNEEEQRNITAEDMEERMTLGTWIEYKDPTVEAEIKAWRAFLARAWGKYGLQLMKFASQTIRQARIVVTRNLSRFPKIQGLNLSSYENQVTDEYPKTVDEARPVFLFTQDRLSEAKDYYTLFLYPREHIVLSQEHSMLIRCMMRFERGEKVLRKYLETRVQLLEPISLQLNYKNYLSASRLLWFELGKCYHELLLLAMKNINTNDENSVRTSVESINQYCSAGIIHLHNYIDSFRNKNSKLPNPAPPEVIGRLTYAHFYLGRMYHAYISLDTEESNDYILIAFSCFRYVIVHCEKDEALMESLKSQYKLLNALRVGCCDNKLLLVHFPPAPEK